MPKVFKIFGALAKKIGNPTQNSANKISAKLNFLAILKICFWAPLLPHMGNVVPMDSKLPSNCPGHHGQLISQNCALTKPPFPHQTRTYDQTKTYDQTFERVPNPNRYPRSSHAWLPLHFLLARVVTSRKNARSPAKKYQKRVAKPHPYLVNFWPNRAKLPSHMGALFVASGLWNSYMKFCPDWSYRVSQKKQYKKRAFLGERGTFCPFLGKPKIIFLIRMVNKLV